MTDNIEDAEWEEIPGNNGNLSKRSDPSQARAEAPSAAPKAKSVPTLWQTVKIWAKRLLIGLGAVFLLIIVLIILTPDTETEGAAPDGSTSPVGPSSEHMLSDWAEFALGEARTTQFGLTDGSGELGEFCSTTKGTAIMAFGPPRSSNGEPESYEEFGKLDGIKKVALYGTFWFDRGAGTLVARAISGQDVESKKPVSVDDFTMKVEQISPGKVSIDGNTFHYCIP